MKQSFLYPLAHRVWVAAARGVGAGSGIRRLVEASSWKVAYYAIKTQRALCGHQCAIETYNSIPKLAACYLNDGVKI